MFRILLFAIIVLITSCTGGKDKPDVSEIKVDVQLQRFEQDFFKIDTNNINQSLNELAKKYPTFLPVFLQYVLGLDQSMDAETQIKFFLNQGRPLYDTAMKKYASFNNLHDNFTEAFKYVKYYYPTYKVPKVITLLGPVDALAKFGETYVPDFLGPDFLAVSLQFYLGRSFSLYQSEVYISNIAPLYRSRRFDKEFIVPDAMKLIVDDVYRDESAGNPLIEQIIEKGKQWYLLDKFLPDAPDSTKTGYTQKQLTWVEENEGNIWGFLIKENLYSIEPVVIQNYLGESPFTQGMPETSPGNIGPWIGWQILKKFEENNKDKSVQEILNTPARTILNEAKYKPK